MPGSRLSHQERRRIAHGLAARESYAEIARQLHRPTSTVTREVLRNGGPAGYRAEQAQAATRHRTRRPRAANRMPQAAPARGSAALHAFRPVFTATLVESGTPRMMARVLAALCLSETGTLTAAELVDGLGVSAASVSKAVAGLESQGLVRRERSARRRECYVVDDDVWGRSLMVTARDTARLADTARRGMRAAGPGSPVAVRLDDMARFLEFVSASVARAAQEARALVLDGRGDPPTTRATPGAGRTTASARPRPAPTGGDAGRATPSR